MSASNQTRIDCEMIPEPSAIERLTRVIRVRGFNIGAMAMETRGDRLHFTMTVHGKRDPAMLARQLEKLETVVAVRLEVTLPHSVGAEYDCEPVAS